MEGKLNLQSPERATQVLADFIWGFFDEWFPESIILLPSGVLFTILRDRHDRTHERLEVWDWHIVSFRYAVLANCKLAASRKSLIL